jgi:DNA-binding MarR family transcriptional regulator
VAPADADAAGAWDNFFQANRVIQTKLEERLELATGLSWAESEVLMRLAIAPGQRLKMIEIADQLLASKSGITRLVDRLEAAGLLVREIPPDNRRVIYGRLTPAGIDAVQRGQVVFMAGLEEAFSRHLSDAEMRHLRRILRRLLEGNGAWEEERCMPGFAEAAQ